MHILTLNNRINGAALLAKTAVDTLGHVDIVARSPPATVLTLFRFDSDRLSGADSLAQLASNAALLSCRIPPQGVLTTEAWGNGALLERIENRVPFPTVRSSPAQLSRGHRSPGSWYSRWPEKLLQQNVHAPEHLQKQEVLSRLIQCALVLLIPPLRTWQPEIRRRRTMRSGGSGNRRREECNSGR